MPRVRFNFFKAPKIIKTKYIRMSNEIIQYFLRLRNTMKVYHWMTLSYPRHKASDALIDKIDDISDKFVEVYIGRYGRDKSLNSSSKKTMTLQLHSLSEKEVTEYIVEARDWLSEKLPSMLKRTDTDLFNIRDEIISELNQCLYLFTLT